jgi:hypothetical protein
MVCGMGKMKTTATSHVCQNPLFVTGVI